MIKLVRVDHRFLHGQVVFSWIKTIGVDCILVANDEVAKDRKQITKAIFVSEDDCGLLRKLHHKGIIIEAQTVPEDTVYDVMKLI